MLDTSVSAAWFFEDQSTAYTETVLQSVIDEASVFVPACLETRSPQHTMVSEPRKKTEPAKSVQFLQDLRRFAITVDVAGLDEVFGDVIDQASLYQRSSYDASYLELAKRRGLPFATRDGPLRKAGEELGLELFRP